MLNDLLGQIKTMVYEYEYPLWKQKIQSEKTPTWKPRLQIPYKLEHL